MNEDTVSSSAVEIKLRKIYEYVLKVVTSQAEPASVLDPRSASIVIGESDPVRKYVNVALKGYTVIKGTKTKCIIGMGGVAEWEQYQ